MKRVLILVLCFVLALSLASCDLLKKGNGDNSNDNNSDTNGDNHVHTYADAWSKDAQGHWYDATCDCEDAPVNKLNHVDANNDGACDVCTYTNHTHTYSEDWTVDCTNHWNAADCGHIVAGTNVAAHADDDADGKCDVCGYTIEDIHVHYYSTEWSYDTQNHWHAALCEHKVEVADKAAHTVNDAGYCTVCDAKVKDIDLTSLEVVLKAAIANNYKVVTGSIIHDQIVYNGDESSNSLILLDSAKDDVYFVLGNGQAYFFIKDYDKNGALVGGEEQWYERITDEDIFAVKMDSGEYLLERIDGDPAKLSGYNYLPGDLLMKYDDTTTLAQTIYNMYDLMIKGEGISDAVSNYNAETGKYTFSYTYVTKNEATSGGVFLSRDLLLCEVSVSFSLNSDLIIDLANIEVKQYAYTNEGNTENDLDYDEATGAITKKAGNCNPTYYVFEAYQTSGQRTFTSPYPKASLLPKNFEFYHVVDHEFPSATEWVINEEVLIGDTLTVNSGDYIYLHLGNPIPTTSSFSFLDSGDFSFTFVNNDANSSGRAWYMDEGSVDAIINGYSQYIGCLKLKMRDAGTYTMTVAMGEVKKEITLVINGEPRVDITGDADSISVLLNNFNAYDDENQTYTYTAAAEGNYTFVIPAGLGVRVGGEDSPRVDHLIDNGGNVTIGLNAGQSVKLYFATFDATRYEVSISYVAADIPDVEEGDDDDDQSGSTVGNIVAGTYELSDGSILVVNSDGTMVRTDAKGYTQNFTYAIDGNTITYTLNGNSYTSDHNMAIYFGYFTFNTDGSLKGFYQNANELTLTLLVFDGTENAPFRLSGAGSNVASFKGGMDLVWYTLKLTQGGFVTLSSDYSGSAWLKMGINPMNATSNDGAPISLRAYYPAGTVVYFGIGDWDENVAEVSFTVAFEAVESDDISDIVGTWTGTGMTMFGSVDYVLSIDSDGEGTLIYTLFGQEIECTVTYVLLIDGGIVIGYENSNTSGSISGTFADDTITITSGVINDTATLTTGNGGGNDDETEIVTSGDLYDGENTVTITDDDINGDAKKVYYTFMPGYTGEYYLWSADLYVSAVLDADGNALETNNNGYYELVGYEEYTVEILCSWISEAGDYIVNADYQYPLGSQENPNEFDFDYEFGTPITITYAGDYQVIWYYFYSVTDGILTVSTEDTAASVMITAAFGYELSNSNDLGEWLPSVSMYIMSGRYYYIGVVDANWSSESRDITVTPSITEADYVADGTINMPNIMEIGDNTANVSEGSYVWFAYKADSNGILTVTSENELCIWYFKGQEDYATAGSKSIHVEWGDIVYLYVETNDYSAAEIAFTVSLKGDPTEAEYNEDIIGDGSAANEVVLEENTYVCLNLSAIGAACTITWDNADAIIEVASLDDEWNTVWTAMANGDTANPVMYMGLIIKVYLPEYASGTVNITITPYVAPPQDLVVGDNTVSVTDTQMGNVVNLPTSEETVTYTITVGENCVVIYEYSNYFVGDTVDIEVAAGASVSFNVATYDYSKSDVVVSVAVKSSTEVEGGENEQPGGGNEPAGTQADPFIVESVPFEVALQAEHDNWFKYVVTEDCTLIISYTKGGNIENIPGGFEKDVMAKTYTGAVTAGQILNINLWGSVSVTYKIEKAVIENPVDPDEGDDENGGDDEVTSTTYTTTHSNGRTMKVVVYSDGTLTVNRSSTSGDFSDTTMANYTWEIVDGVFVCTSTGSSNVTAISFSADGTPLSVTWMGANYENFTVENANENVNNDQLINGGLNSDISGSLIGGGGISGGFGGMTKP